MSDHRKAFRKFASRIQDFETVENITLFGSVARGDHGSRSDVDVLVKVSDLSERDRIEEEAFETASELGVSITPVIKQEEDSSDFMETVREEGEEYVRS